MTSADQLNRIVNLVSHLTRLGRQGVESVALDDLAGLFEVSRSQVQQDIRTLTLLGDDPDADWLLSLSVWQEGGRVFLSSGGPFQRPLRFTGDELIALQLGLSQLDDDGSALSRALAALLLQAEPVSHALSGRGRVAPSVRNLMLGAVTDRKKVEIRYTGETSLGGINRMIHPYQVLEQEGHGYVVAWCETANGWRHFRFDRILDALPANEHYVPRSDFTPAGDSFAEPDETTAVEVRFSPAVARWVRERHPEARVMPDGGIAVTYRVANPEWVVRFVLQYGPEAEVLSPPSFRELMRREVQ